MDTMDVNGEILGLCESLIKQAEIVKEYVLRLRTTQSDTLRKVYTSNLMDELPHIQNLTIAVGSILTALNAGKIIGAIKMIGSAVGKVGLKFLPIVAVIAIIALAIEDLIGFMNGEKRSKLPVLQRRRNEIVEMPYRASTEG